MAIRSTSMVVFDLTTRQGGLTVFGGVRVPDLDATANALGDRSMAQRSWDKRFSDGVAIDEPVNFVQAVMGAELGDTRVSNLQPAGC